MVSDLLTGLMIFDVLTEVLLEVYCIIVNVTD